MKKTTFLFLTIFMVAVLYSQTYEIKFAGSGSATVVDSVMIENLKQGVFQTLKGDAILKLNIITHTGIFNNDFDIRKVRAFPNPMTTQTEIEFNLDNSSNVMVSVFDLSGRSVVQSSRLLQPGIHKYRITGLDHGIYLVEIYGQDFRFTTKLISQGIWKGKAGIVYVSSDNNQLSPDFSNNLKSASPDTEIDCNEGDRLKLTGMSGNFSSVLTWVPACDSIITFDFMDCTDADSNHYPVVTIGTQTWMAENLKTTRYNDSSTIPLITDSAAWSLMTTPAYCWYNNDSLSYMNTYGALYNWYVIDSSSNGNKNVCPTGWHVPDNNDWLILTTYAGGAGLAGGKLKETGTMHWNTPNTGATNETGFTVLGAGWRSHVAGFLHLGVYNCSWSSSDPNSSNAFYLEFDYNNGTANRYDWYKPSGFSVRCVKD